MKYKIQYICPHQAGKVLALIMLLITLPFVLLAAFTKVLGLMSGGMQLAMPTLLIIAPLLYVVAGYLMGVFFSWIYNLTIKLTGGFELVLQEVPEVVQEPESVL